MMIWRFTNPNDERFAEASRRGAWSAGGQCPICKASTARRVRPLLLEWESGSDRIGDFVVTGFDSDVAISDPVAKALADVQGFELGPVEMVANASLVKRPASAAPRVWLPYVGSSLFELWVNLKVPLDLQRSTVTVSNQCDLCGRREYAAEGLEMIEGRWDKSRGELVRTRIPRAAHAGLFVSDGLVPELAVFRVKEFPAWVLCTDAVRSVVQREKFSNVDFFSVGETL